MTTQSETETEVHLPAERQKKFTALLWRAVGVLGRIALRRRDRLSKREAWMLEDDLFACLEELNDLKELRPDEGTREPSESTTPPQTKRLKGGE